MWSDSKNGNAVEFEKNAQYMSAKGFTMDVQISVDIAKQICMRDWKLRATSRYGLTVCVSMVLLKTIIKSAFQKWKRCRI